MIFAGAELVSGGPSKSTIVPITNSTTYTTPPRNAQRATFRGRATATAASIDPSLRSAGTRCPAVKPESGARGGRPADLPCVLDSPHEPGQLRPRAAAVRGVIGASARAAERAPRR